MTIEYLKRGKPAAERAEDDARTRSVVETTLADIETRGDAAVRDLSAKFDGYAPDSFRLSLAEIESLMTELSEKVGAPVAIRQEKGGKGKLVISYNSLDELDGILAHIK